MKTQIYKSKVVEIGNVNIGGENPVVLQSMTNTDTLNLDLTVEQCIKIIDAGGKLVRITAQGVKEATFLEEIKLELLKRGYNNPIIADIHFNPKAAEVAAQKIEKVRINPGNYIDKNSDIKQSFTEDEYNAEIQKIETNILPLIKICKEHNTAIRIGSNHGSLSNRILDKYGDTPKGMVEAAMEFIRICHKEDFHNIVVSMKSSNPKIMVYSTRLLVKTMLDEGMNYPIHLGVTEAGDAEDGRIKSALGIGALLIDGIGDTIRVSLTEEPEKEIPVARKIASYYIVSRNSELPFTYEKNIDFFNYNKQETDAINNIGGNEKPIVFHTIKALNNIELSETKHINKNNMWQRTDFSPDYIFTENLQSLSKEYDNLHFVVNNDTWNKFFLNKSNVYPMFSANNFLTSTLFNNNLNFVKFNVNELTNSLISKLKTNKSFVGILNITPENSIKEQRSVFTKLKQENCKTPIVISREYSENDIETLQIKSAGDYGSIFVDGFGDGMWLNNTSKNQCFAQNEIPKISFGILQAAKLRITQTEFIACPGCGRTNYNLQETLQKIKEKTSHLKGLKIGVMGCVVNGPGEMADADYGYVGGAKNKVSLYKKKVAIKKNIPQEDALEELIALIKENGDWIDK